MPRSLLHALLCLVVLGAGCPMGRGEAERPPADAVRVTVVEDEIVPLYDDRLRLSVVSMTRTANWAKVTLRLRADGRTVEKQVTAVRQADYSEPVELDPFVVRIRGLPGVDRVPLVVWERSETTTGQEVEP